MYNQELDEATLLQEKNELKGQKRILLPNQKRPEVSTRRLN